MRCLLSGACLEAHGCPTKEIVALCLIKCQNVNGLEAVVKLSPLTCRLLFFMNITTRLLNEVRFGLELVTYTMVASLSKGERGLINNIKESYPQLRSANERRAKEDMLKGIKAFINYKQKHTSDSFICMDNRYDRLNSHTMVEFNLESCMNQSCVINSIFRLRVQLSFCWS